MNIFFAAGGSGGHITPALAVAEELNIISPKTNIIFLCFKNDLDKKILNEAGVDFIPIFSGKLRRYFSLQNILDFFFFIIGIFQSIFLILKYKPKVIFSKGGFVGLPVGFAAKILGVSVILHESDNAPGLSNRILAKYAKKILASFPESNFKKETIYTGTPVRSVITNGNKEKGLKFLEIKHSKKPLILVLGGSQGATFLNEIIKKTYKKIDANFAIICGQNKNIFKNDNQLKAYEYVGKEFGNVLQAADLIISRSGANTIAEIAALKKPCILIPLETSANNHQQKNAEALLEKNAAILIEQEKITSNKFTDLINVTIKDKKKLEDLSKNIAQFYKKDAAKKIAREILESI